MLTNRNIICFANDWRNDPTSKHQIMKILAQENKIIWVNSIGLRTPSIGKSDALRILNKLKSFARGLEKINDNFYVFTPIVIPFHRFKLIKAINSIILKLLLKAHIKKLGMKDIIYWSYLPNVGYIIEKMDVKTLVYHCVDEWSKFSFIDENIIKTESALCKTADLVIASAKTLFDSRSPYNPNTYYVPHGVDYSYFHEKRSADTPLPAEMTDIPKPIAGFFGLIHEWIDLDLLAWLAKNNPEVSFVFIGKYSVDVDQVNQYSNAYFLGQKPYDELIDYAKHFDVGLIPFKINELTINVNPIKLKEYLALGIPVISVNLPEVDIYRQVVRIEETYDSFDQALKQELSGQHIATLEQLEAVAREETWSRKVDEISDLIRGVENR